MAPHPKATDLPALLAKLCDAGVAFIIVGGAACVIQGAPITTNDLDIVHSRTPENIERLLDLLLQLDATMRHDFANRGLRPTAELLAGKGHLNLSTSLGPIDPLCELDGLGYDELLPCAIDREGRSLLLHATLDWRIHASFLATAAPVLRPRRARPCRPCAREPLQ